MYVNKDDWWNSFVKVHEPILIVVVELHISDEPSVQALSGNESKNKTFTKVHELRLLQVEGKSGNLTATTHPRSNV